jgi:hypothetical protein
MVKSLSKLFEVWFSDCRDQKSDYRSNTVCVSLERSFGVRSLQDLPFGDVMKRIAAFMLLVALSVAGAIPAQAQRTSVEEHARQSRAAAKQQNKMLKKSAKKQRKAMKRSAKAQRKAIKKANNRRAQ